MMMDFDDDFDLILRDLKEANVIKEHREDIFDLSFSHSTPSFSRAKVSSRSIDFPSSSKHYGLVTFLDQQWPIIYRLINEQFYIPYIRFSYVLQIFSHSKYQNVLVNIRNLPVIEMSPIESVYYQELDSLSLESDWSHQQLLSVSILDGLLAMFELMKHCDRSDQWRDALTRLRQETQRRWILDEQIVLTRLSKFNEPSTSCISSTNMAKRRSFFEQRLDLSIIDQSGGFIQIDRFIYPFVRHPTSEDIFLHLNDLQHNFLSSLLLPSNDHRLAIVRSYNVMVDQSQSIYQWNQIHYGRQNDFAKILPCPQHINENNDGDFRFISLQTLLGYYYKKPFVQLFENSSFEQIRSDYQNNLGREFILAPKGKVALVNGMIPCLIQSDEYFWIPSETVTTRKMSNDERIYLNMILLYRGLVKELLSKNIQWFFKDISHQQENVQLQILFDSK